jgi:hypothetical protein
MTLVVGTLVLNGLLAPGAVADEGSDDLFIVEIVNQPTDAAANELITAAPHDPTGGDAGFVQVSVRREGYEGTEAVQYAEVNFELATGEGSATGMLNVVSRTTNADGIATFGPDEDTDNPLSISDENQPLTTDYRLIPVATVDDDDYYEHDDDETESVDGAPSAPFDIWGEGCHGTGCNVTVRNGNDSYTALEDVGLGVSVVPAGSTEVVCPQQRLIFAGSVFFHTTTGDGTDVVSLETHITREDMAAAPLGGKYVGWCLGLKTPTPWMNNGGRFTTQIVAGQTFYVALAPACPKRGDAADFAPCIQSQTSDGAGGKIFRGFVLGGDPPRRT